MSRSDPHHAGMVLNAVRSPSGAAVSAVAASWCRSMLSHGLDPETPFQRLRVNDTMLHCRRAEHADLLSVAGRVLDQMFRLVGRSGCGVVLTDRQGLILERRVGDADAGTFTAAGLVEGGRWSEADEGTNGIGTCLIEDRPLVIHRDQHFASRNIGISCMDAPVHDPHGRLIAALDVSSCRDDHSPAMAEMIGALVRDAATRIERDYFCRHYDGQRIIYLSDDGVNGVSLLAADRDGLVVGASRGARLRMGLDDKALQEPLLLDQLMGNERPPSFEDADRTVLRQALARAGGNASLAARQLGIGRATLYRRLARAGLRH